MSEHLPRGGNVKGSLPLKGRVIKVLRHQESEFLRDLGFVFDEARVREDRDGFVRAISSSGGGPLTSAETVYKISFSEDVRVRDSLAGAIYDVLDRYDQDGLVHQDAAEVEQYVPGTLKRKRREPLNEALQTQLHASPAEVKGYLDVLENGCDLNHFVRGRDYQITTQPLPKSHPEVGDVIEITVSFTPALKEKYPLKVRNCLCLIKQIDQGRGPA